MTSVFPTTPINICSLLSFGILFVLIIPLALHWDNRTETPGILPAQHSLRLALHPWNIAGATRRSRGQTPGWDQSSLDPPGFSRSSALLSCCSGYQGHPGGSMSPLPLGIVSLQPAREDLCGLTPLSAASCLTWLACSPKSMDSLAQEHFSQSNTHCTWLKSKYHQWNPCIYLHIWASTINLAPTPGKVLNAVLSECCLFQLCPAKFRKIKAKPVALVWNLSLFMQQEISALIQVWCLLPPNLLSAGPQGWDALGCMNVVSPHGLQSDWRMHNSVPEFKDGTGWWSSLQGSWTARCQHVLHWHLNSLNWGLPAH